MAFLMMGETEGGGEERSRDPPLSRAGGFFHTCRSVRDRKCVVLDPEGESGSSLFSGPP